MYLSITKIAKMYDVSINYIKSNFDLVEDEHFIFIGKMKRYNKEKMQELLEKKQDAIPANKINLDNFLV